MIKRLLTGTFLWFILVGSIAWATAIITGNNIPTFIHAETIQIGNYTNTLYTLDVYNYLKQIENQTININIPGMIGEFPKLPTISSLADIGKLLINLFIWLLNFYIWWFNLILITPLKVLVFYPTLFIATILGIDINSEQSYFFMTIFNYMMQNIGYFQIKYI